MSERIERELLLPASPTEVWDVVTADGWLADELELELEPGGEARFRSGELVRAGWVEEAAPPSEDRAGRLSFWWSAEGEVATRVELRVEPAGDGLTRLRVSETRPLDVLDVIGIPLPGAGGPAFGPALLAA